MRKSIFNHKMEQMFKKLIFPFNRSTLATSPPSYTSSSPSRRSRPSQGGMTQVRTHQKSFYFMSPLNFPHTSKIPGPLCQPPLLLGCGRPRPFLPLQPILPLPRPQIHHAGRVRRRRRRSG